MNIQAFQKQKQKNLYENESYSGAQREERLGDFADEYVQKASVGCDVSTPEIDVECVQRD
jgi:hypothetical protein